MADGSGFSASIVDATLYIANNHEALRARGATIVLYLPKIQTAEEAALWHDILSALEDVLGLPAAVIKVYVLVEQLEASYQLMALARLLPPPSVHRQRYHGVLAPHARLRPCLTAWARQAARQENDHELELCTSAHTGTAPGFPHPSAAVSGGAPSSPSSIRPPRSHEDRSPAALPSAARSLWARLLARSYEALPLRCPDCGADMRILAFLTQPEPVHAILHHLGLPTRPASPLPGPRAS